MGIFDDVVVNARSAAEAVGRKAGQLVDVSKLRIGAAEVNAEITKRYEALGQYVYENCRSSLVADPEAFGKITEIDELKAQAAAIAKELNDKQNKLACPSCGKQCSNTDTFCSCCGAKLVVEEAAAEPQPEAPENHEEPPQE